MSAPKLPIPAKSLVALVEIGLSDSSVRGEIGAPHPETLTVQPGCADLQLARVRRLGHRGRFPRAHEWETLLAMLCASEELLWIIEKRGGRFESYFGLKVNRGPLATPSAASERRNHFRSLLNHFARRSFPESTVEEQTPAEVCGVLSRATKLASGHTTVVSGQPSPKALEDAQQFAPRSDTQPLDASLNDALEPFLDHDPFCIVITLGRATNAEVLDRLTMLCKARDLISPLIKQQSGKSDSRQTSTQKSTGSGRSQTTSQQDRRNVLTSIWQALVGADTDEKEGKLSHARDRGSKVGRKWWRDASVNYQYGENTSESSMDGVAEQSGTSITQTELNAGLEMLDHSLDASIKLLRTGVGTGAFFSSAMIYTPDPDLGRRIGVSLAATLSGSKTHLRPFQVIPYSGPGVCAHLTHQGAAHAWFPGLAILSNHLAAQMFLTPEAELPGLRMKRNVFYGRSETATDDGKNTWLGDVAFLRSGIRLRDEPHRPGGALEAPQFEIPIEDLLSHVLVTGTTGSGKTRRAVAILNRVDPAEFQIVVLESAKKTFRKLLARHGVGRRVFTLGESREAPLRVNPFFFEPGTSLKRHISVLSDALSDLLPVEALIGPKLREAIQNAYRDLEWDIESGSHTGSGLARYPTVLDLNLQVLRVANALRYSPELKANYLGALTGRSQLFIVGSSRVDLQACKLEYSIVSPK